MRFNKNWISVSALLAAALLVFVACVPAAPPPTPTSTTAPPTATSTAAPKSEATAAGPTASSSPTAAQPTPTGTPIKLGFINPFSGPVAYLGAEQRVAVKLAEEDVNASGGINGSPLQIVSEDSPFDPKQTVTDLRKLAEQDNVFAVVGPYSSAEMEVAAPLSNQLKLVVASGSSTEVGVAENNRPWSFQMNIPDSVSTPATIDGFKKAYPNVKNVVLVGDTQEAVTEAMVDKVFPQLLPEKGLKVLTTIPFDTSTTDFSAIVTKIKSYNPDGIVVAALMPGALGIAKELQRQEVKVPVMTDAHPLGPLPQLGGSAVEGWVQPALFDWQSSDPKVQSFVERDWAAAKADPLVVTKPQEIVTEGTYYDTVMIMADIMRKAGITGNTPLQEARQDILAGMTNLQGYKGISGTYSMLPSGNAQREAIPPVMVVNGKWKFIR